MELPIPAAEQVRQRVGPMDEHDGVVIVFLGTTPSDRYQARIVEVRIAPGNVEVVIATHAPERLESMAIPSMLGVFRDPSYPSHLSMSSIAR